jgi:RNA polymerase sigma factor (sigma-70 family)
MPLSQEAVVRTLLAARTRISASAWMIARDAQAAEDIFQNLSVKALAGESRFDVEAQLISWAHIAARHEALNWIRSRKGRALSLDEAVLDLVASEGETNAPGEGLRVEALRGCLDGLPASSRDLLDLRYSEERSCADIARDLGLTVRQVRRYVARGYEKLRQALES